MATVNIKEKLWKAFLKQSIDLDVSASSRITKFMEDQLSNNSIDEDEAD